MPVAAAPTGNRVLVVGAGPSGLAAAYHLTRLGYAVTVKDAGNQPGGMMRYGIPQYRLPREILDAEIDRILRLGVTLELNTRVTDLLAGPAVSRGDAPPYPPMSARPGLIAKSETVSGPTARTKSVTDSREERVDAVFVAVGAHISKRAYIPAGDSARIMDAVTMLHSVEDGEPPLLGRRVAVYGGSNTAMDA